MNRFKEKAKDFAAAGFNKLPDSANLFLRYMTGVGGRNLDLDDKTITAIRESTKNSPFTGRQRILGPVPDRKTYTPQSGAINPYFGGFKDADKVKTTLGRFTSKVNPEKNTINVSDTYDMINEAEDPDLVSGKIQPFKAAKELLGVGHLGGVGYGGPLGIPTRIARAGMYISPIKPKAFDVDIDIPYSGDINNREKYN